MKEPSLLVSEALGRALPGLGIEAAFGLVGSGNYEFVTGLQEAGVRYYATRHEAGAVCMADGYARTSGKVGLATVHQGPGLTNALTPLTEAAKSRTPLILVAADMPRTSLHGNQRIDQFAIVRSLGALAERLRDASTAIDDLARAVHRAQTERLPVVLMLPLDVQHEPCPGDGRPSHGYPAPGPPRPAPDAVAEVADLVARAERPVILAGRGAVRAGAREPLEALADRIGALLAVSAVAKGLFEGNPFSIGISGGFGSPLASDLLPQADLVLGFGASLNAWTTRNGALISESARVVQVDIEEPAIGSRRPATVGVVADAAETGTALLQELERRGVTSEGFRTRDVATQVREYRCCDEFQDESTADGLDPRTVMCALDRMLPEQRTVTIDSGHFMGWPSMYLSVPDARGWVFAQGFQCVGLGLGIGMGALAGRPGRLGVVVAGDGGTMMSLAEIETAVRCRLPILLVILNDAAYGAEVHHFEPLGLSGDLARFADVDFARVASGMGAEAHTVRTLEELSRLEDRFAGLDGPMVLDCKLNPAVRAGWLDEVAQAASA